MDASNSLRGILERIICSWVPRRVEAPASTPTMSRDFWMPDRSCRYCFECESAFSLFNRRHHCRLCGRVFCGKCSLNTIPALVEEGISSEEGERVRVCNYCYKLREQDSTPPDGPTPTLTPSSSGRSMASSGFGTGASVVPVSPQQTVSGGSSDRPPFIWDEALDVSSEPKHTMRNRQGGSRVIGSMSSRARDQPASPYRFDNRSDDRSDDDEDEYGKEQHDSEHRGSELQDPQDDDEDDSCAELAQDLRDMERKSESSLDSSHGSIGHNPLSDDGSESIRRGGETSDGKGSSESLDEGGDDYTPLYEGAVTVEGSTPVDYESNALIWIPPAAGDDQDDDDEEDDDVGTSIVDEDDEDEEGGGWGVPVSPGSGSSLDIKKDRTPSDEHRKAMRAQVAGYFRNLVAQLLQQECIDVGEPGNHESWLEIVSALSWQAASLVKPDTSKGDGMDPVGYVKVKCIASGRPSDSFVVKGIVCRKNVAHKRMTSRYKNPRILLLGGALEYQRVPNQLSSLDTLLQQERDHLSMTVARIEAHHPNVLLVEKAVSRFAQDILLNKEITLVLNVKKPLLERIARCLGAQVVPSPDNLVAPKAMHCELFHVEKFVEEHGSAGSGGKPLTKFLMFFEGCPKPLGCTVLLKGANGDYLKKVKKVMPLAVYSAYHLALETSFLEDEGALIPEFPCRSPLCVPVPNKHHTSSAGPGLTIAVPGQSQQAKYGQYPNLSLSPLPSRANSIGSSTAFNHLDTSTAANMVPFSESSSCVSSANNSPGTSPAQSSFGFQSGMIRNSSIGGSSTTTYHHISNGIYPGGQSWQGFSGLSVSLRKDGADDNPHKYGPAEGGGSSGGNGSLTFEMKALESSIIGGISNAPNHDQTITSTASTVTKGTIREAGDDYHVMPEEVNAQLGVLIQDSWQSEMQLSKEDFPPSPSDHRSILVQLSSRCLKKGVVCKKAPQFLRIRYYGNADEPLGRFLRDKLFDPSNTCEVCEEPCYLHVSCFTHRQGSLTISVSRMKPEMALSGERDGRIWMWHRCLRCPPVNGVPPATPRVIMSDAAWGLSFGKFLELSFSTNPAASRVAACGHSLHRDCLRFYGFGTMVACFRYAQINLHSVYLPPLQLEFNCPQQQDWLQKEVDEVAAQANLVFVEVVNRLRVLGEKIASSRALYGNSTALDAKRRIVALETLLQKEKAAFEEALQKAAPPVRSTGRALADILELNWLRRELFIRSVQWDSRLEYLTSKSLPLRKRATGSIDDPSILSPKESTTVNGNLKMLESQEPERNSSSSEALPSLQQLPSDVNLISRNDLGLSLPEQASVEDDSPRMQLSASGQQGENGDINSNQGPLCPVELGDGNGLDFRLGMDKISAPGELLVNVTIVSRKGHLSGSKSVMVDSPILKELSSQLEITGEEGSAESSICKDSTALLGLDSVIRTIPSRFLEGDITARRALSEGNFPLLADLSDTLDAAWTGEGGSGDVQNGPPVSTGKESYQVKEGNNDAGLVESVQEPVSADQATRETGVQGEDVAAQDKGIMSDSLVSSPTSPVKSNTLEDLTEGWMGAPFTTFTKSYNRTSSNLSNNSDAKLPSPGLFPRAGQLAGDGGARVLLPVGHDDVVVAVYDDEPTSIIAYAISTEEHYVHVTDIPVEKDKIKDKDQEKDSDHLNPEQALFHPLQSSDIFGEGDSASKDSSGSSADSLAPKLEPEVENPLISTKASQMVKKTITFGDDSSQAKVKFQVICYFAKQFDALRKKCCMGNTEYIRSLCRCKKWGAQGGKSNVFFAKTADDRFVVKQVTRTELNSFLVFASVYFKYLSEALTTGNPTCLAKILGVYEVKITKAGKETKMDLLVMENLLYGRHISRLYDLKGSVRSRYNADSTGKNQVLLDENLREAMPTNPIFVGNKAKRLLERAIWNDTHFLSEQAVSVMDYSLLVGVDEERQELVVGIIDYIRKYTWDKHLETWVKTSGFLGGPKNEAPTVISPKQYKKRFRKAMSTYFLMVPDQWIPPPVRVSQVVDTVEDSSIGHDTKADDVPDDPDTPRHL